MEFLLFLLETKETLHRIKKGVQYIMKNMYFLDVTFSHEDKLKILTSVGIVPIETYFFFEKKLP